MKNRDIRIGMIGTGRITERFWDECKYVEGMQITAIYNRHMESLQWFAERKQIPAGNDVLFTDDLGEFYQAVDAVYVASPHEYHVSYTMDALEHGKHVLCEKPMAVKRADAEAIFGLARAKDLVCMEAIKTASCPGFAEVMHLVQGGVIGIARDIDATFTKIGSAAGREMWSNYGGSFVELASYVLLPVMKIYGVDGERPEIHTFSLAGAPRHDSYTKMMLVYHDHVATVKTGLGVKSEGELIISGDRGYIRVPSPWWLTKRIEVHHEDPNQVEIYEKPFEGAGLRYEIAEFVKMIQKDESDQESFVRLLGRKPDADEEKARKRWHMVNAEESIWLAEIMEIFRREQTAKDEKDTNKIAVDQDAVKIWAHRGCSMAYPENTLLAFKKAAEIPGITGVELDVQKTRDGRLVVIHDEEVDRTTDACGRVCDFSLEEIQGLHITGSGQSQVYVLSDADRDFMGTAAEKAIVIPTLEEVLDVLRPYCRSRHLQINIELKNGKIAYEGMEQEVIDLVHAYALEDHVVYSSFNCRSLAEVQRLDPQAKIAILAGDYHKCLDDFYFYHMDAMHPGNLGMPVNADDVRRLRQTCVPVRMYNGSEPLYGQRRRLPDMDLREYAKLGATDIFTNVPERYLDKTCKK